MNDYSYTPTEFIRCDIVTAGRLRKLGLTIYCISDIWESFAIYFGGGSSFHSPSIGEAFLDRGNGMSNLFPLYYNIDDLV